MKKIYGLLTAVAMCLFLVSCGGKPASVVSESTEPAQAAVSSVKEDELTESVTEPFQEETEKEMFTETEENGGTDMGAAKLYYQGHASMRIDTAEGKTIYVDPFMGDGYDVPADLILMTHGHYDHTQTKLIETQNPDCETISWKEAIKDGEHQNFDLGYVKVEAVEAGYNKNHNVKDCVGFILTFSNGVTLYLTGDTSTTPQMSELAEKNLDYAFFCCDGVYNMNVDEAIECAKTVGARHSIPYHMIPANEGGFDEAVAESFEVEGKLTVRPGETLVLE